MIWDPRIETPQLLALGMVRWGWWCEVSHHVDRDIVERFGRTEVFRSLRRVGLTPIEEPEIRFADHWGEAFLRNNDVVLAETHAIAVNAP